MWVEELSLENESFLSIVALEVDMSRNGKNNTKVTFSQVDEESRGVVLGEWKIVS